MARALTDFLGKWRLVREIAHADGGTGCFEGQAVWTPDTGGAVCRESGWLVLPEQGRFAAERVYRWTVDLSVFFEDGRFFHRVPLDGGEASHWCDPDQYDATYDFSAWPNWSYRWRVRGPRKEYTMISRYQPADS